MPIPNGISPSYHVMLPPGRGLPSVTDVCWAERGDMLGVLCIAA